MNKDAEGRRKVERSESNWKCGLKFFDGSQDALKLRRVTDQAELGGVALKQRLLLHRGSNPL